MKLANSLKIRDFLMIFRFYNNKIVLTFSVNALFFLSRTHNLRSNAYAIFLFYSGMLFCQPPKLAQMHLAL